MTPHAGTKLFTRNVLLTISCYSNAASVTENGNGLRTPTGSEHCAEAAVVTWTLHLPNDFNVT